MSKPKTERNEKIVELREIEKLSFRKIARKLVDLGLDEEEMDKKNVSKIYYREKQKMEATV